MDKTEKFLKDELSHGVKDLPVDMEALIAGTHSTIQRRATRRKAIYSSPLVILLFIAGIMLFPKNGEVDTLPGSELFMAGWEYSWTEAEDLELESDEEVILFDQTVDYLIDDNYFTYLDDTEAIFDDNDLEALKGFLKEV